MLRVTRRARRALAAAGVVAAVAASAAPVWAAPPSDGPGRSETRNKHRAEDTTTTTTTSSSSPSSVPGRSQAARHLATATTVAGGQAGVDDKAAKAEARESVAAASITAAALGLTIETITWDIVGLDSTDVDDGPNTYPVGVRVCATGGSASDVTVTFTWDSFNPYLNLLGTSVLAIASLADGACADRYFFVVVTRDEAAYDTTRSYHVTASADGVPTVSTPVPRQLYVEKLLSQNRNSVLSVEGPTTVYEGETVTYTVTASTAPNGYSQLTTFLTMLGPIFQLTEVDLTYETPSGRQPSPYVDACGWDPDPTSPTYRSCIGPEKVPGGAAGGDLVGTFSGVVVGTGSTTMSNAIIDVSGSSYHYNTDYGTAPNLIAVLALPSTDLALTKSALGSFIAGTTGAFRLTVGNLGPSTSGTPVVVTDSLPSGMTFLDASGDGWTCTAAGRQVTCTHAAALAAGTSSSVTVLVSLADSLVGATVNSAVVSSPARDVAPDNNTATARATVVTLEEARATTPEAVSRSGTRTDSGATGAGAAAAAGSQSLAVTGADDSAALTLLGLALVVVGGGVRRAGRRRST